MWPQISNWLKKMEQTYSHQNRSKIWPAKNSSYNQITARILQELPTYLYNAILRLWYIPNHWKRAKMIMTQKSDKAPEKPSSLRPTSLLPVISTLFEKLYTQWLIKTWSQFGFRAERSMVEQVHRVGATIWQALEVEKFYLSIFLEVSQVFDRVWIKGLLHKFSQNFSMQHMQILKSYLSDRTF